MERIRGLGEGINWVGKLGHLRKTHEEDAQTKEKNIIRQKAELEVLTNSGTVEAFKEEARRLSAVGWDDVALSVSEPAGDSRSMNIAMTWNLRLPETVYAGWSRVSAVASEGRRGKVTIKINGSRNLNRGERKSIDRALAAAIKSSNIVRGHKYFPLTDPQPTKYQRERDDSNRKDIPFSRPQR